MVLIETHETTLTDKDKKSVKVQCSDFPARLGLRLATRLMAFMTPFLSVIDFIDSKDNKKTLDKDIDMSKLSEALSHSIDDEKILRLIISLMSFTRVDGQEVNQVEVFDIVFAGNYGLLFGTLKFILEANFKTFFGGKAIGKILSKMTIA